MGWSSLAVSGLASAAAAAARANSKRKVVSKRLDLTKRAHCQFMFHWGHVRRGPLRLGNKRGRAGLPLARVT